MKIEIKGNKEDIASFKALLLEFGVCPFLNNEEVSCIDGDCRECVELHIDFIEQKLEDDPLGGLTNEIN